MPLTNTHGVPPKGSKPLNSNPGLVGAKTRGTPNLDSARITPSSASRIKKIMTNSSAIMHKVTKSTEKLEVPNFSRDSAINRATPKAPAARPKVPTSIFYERHSAGSPCIGNRSTPTRTPSIRGSDVTVKVCTPEIYTAVRFETPRKHLDHSNPGVEKSNLVVAVRVRPQSQKEEQDKEMKPVVVIKDTEVSILTDYGQTHNFTYDYCFSSSDVNHRQFANQEKVYNDLAKPLLDKAFEGFNTCLFAYGQTGSGKSYSIMGNIGVDEALVDTTGIVPRFCYDLFRKIEVQNKKNSDSNIHVQISYFEIYKEKIQDLLSPAKASLRVREHPQSGPYVVDLSHHAVSSFEEVQRWLLVGNRQRATAATSANERSSRSHAIFTITLAQSHEEKLDGQSHEIRRESRINFIDLAGSERVASVNSTGERREEGLTINQSLLTLGRVITALAEQTFVPYRESVLTWLLKESLGGDSKTVMLATVSPCAGHVEETLSTLRYACQARTIVNTARVSEDPNIRLIRNLRQQIEMLQQRTRETDVRVSVEAVVSGSHSNTESAQRVSELEDEILKLRQKLNDINLHRDASWKEKVTEAEKKRREAEEILSNYGLSTQIDPKQPCLVNVNQDPLLSGTLIFVLKPGPNWIGRASCSANPPEIQLSGYMIEEQHGCIDYVDGSINLRAFAETYVNGQLVNSPVRLHHADRIIIAGTHYFHLHNPKDIRKTAIKVPDYQTAYEELRRVQEERLQAAVLEAQENTRRQLLVEMEELRNEAALEMSLQRHSYEDEIASLNRALEQRKTPDLISPTLPPTPTAKSVIWDDLETILQDAERRLNMPAKKSESIFLIQSMLNEANAICRRFEVPYDFSYKEALEDGLQTIICVHDRQRRLSMKWTVETMKEKMRILREAAEESHSFPTNLIFNSGDDWQLEDDNFVTTSIRDKLDRIQKRHECSFSVLDESRFSFDSSSRRSSLLPRSPPVNPSVITADACRDWLSKPLRGSSLSSIFSMSYDLNSLLTSSERSSKFAVGISLLTHTLATMMPVLIEQTLALREMPAHLRHGWMSKTLELRRDLQNAVSHVLQSINLESGGLFIEWVEHTKEANISIISLLCELCAVVCKEMPDVEASVTDTVAFSGFLSAQIKMHQSVLETAEDVRSRIAQLPEEASTDTLDMSNSSFNTGWLVKACHDCVAQVQILLERCATTLEKSSLGTETNLLKLHNQFHHRIDILLRMDTTMQNLMSYLETSDLNQIKYCVAALEVLSKSYTQPMDDTTSDVLLCDLSFAASMVHKIVAERRRMTVLRRGRDISYSPLPARLLASPSRKRVLPYDDSVESNESHSPESHDSGEDSMDDLHLSPTVIQRALRFEEPAKSSLKSSGNRTASSMGRNVRFNVSDSPASSPSPIS